MYLQKLQLSRIGEGMHESDLYREQECIVCNDFSLSLEEVHALTLVVGQRCPSRSNCKISDTPMFCGRFKSELGEDVKVR